MMTFQDIKRDVYAMRNGIVADSLRQGGCPYRLIFGLNLPQLNEIAGRVGYSRELSDEFRRHSDLRENALLAILLFPPEQLTIDIARRMVADVRWSEDADILCFKLLKRAPFAATLAAELCAADDALARYTGLRLYFGIVGNCPAEALAAAETELKRPQPIATLAAMLREEAQFLLG